MSEMRRAALTLHALQENDRRWVLRQLDARAQQALQGLLAELTELGIPADGTLIEQALRAPHTTQQAAEQAEWRRELAASDPECLQAVLGREPPALVARILDAGPWPWERGLLGSLPSGRRDAVISARGDVTSRVGSGELDAWLAQRLHARWAARAIEVADMAPISREAGE
jgi:hypothetical protein